MIKLLYNSPDLTDDLEYPNMLPISIDSTLHHIERLSNEGIHQEFAKFWTAFYAAKSRPSNPPSEPIPGLMRELGRSHRHIAGLIDICLKLQDTHRPFVIIEPETSLHPSLQVALGDLFILLNLRGQNGR